MTGLLETRTAVIYGAGGAVAQAFARVGAQVVLAGRRLAPLRPQAGAARTGDDKDQPGPVAQRV